MVTGPQRAGKKCREGGGGEKGAGGRGNND